MSRAPGMFETPGLVGRVGQLAATHVIPCPDESLPIVLPPALAEKLANTENPPGV